MPTALAESFNIRHSRFDLDEVKRLTESFAGKLPKIEGSVKRMMEREMTIDEKIEFVRYLDELLEEEVGPDEVLEDEDEILDFVCTYIEAYTLELEKGYSIDWARQYADHLALEDENDTERAAALAFEAVMMVNPKKANKDLDLIKTSLRFMETSNICTVAKIAIPTCSLLPNLTHKSLKRYPFVRIVRL